MAGYKQNQTEITVSYSASRENSTVGLWSVHGSLPASPTYRASAIIS